MFSTRKLEQQLHYGVVYMRFPKRSSEARESKKCPELSTAGVIEMYFKVFVLLLMFAFFVLVQVQGQLAACLLLRGTMRFDSLAGVHVVASLVRSMGQASARCAFSVEQLS